MGCLLSFFRRGTLKLPESTGQLTDTVLKGSATEDRQEGSADQKNGATAVKNLHDNSNTAESDHTEDDDSDEPLDDDKALLLGALGATAAGAVTVGAVAGALKTAQDRDGPQGTDQYQTEQLSNKARDREEPPPVIETSKTAEYQEETVPAVQDSSELASTTGGKVKSHAAELGRASLDTSDKPPGDGGAATTAATIIGTSSAATAAALIGAEPQPNADSAAVGGTDDLPQMKDAETEEDPEERVKGVKEVQPADEVTKDETEEESKTLPPEIDAEYHAPTIPSPERSEDAKPSEAATPPAGNADEISVQSSEYTHLQSEPAKSASLDDSVFEDKQSESRPGSVREQRQSPTLATDADLKLATENAEPVPRPQSATSGTESPSALLPEPPSTSPHSDKEEGPSRASFSAAELAEQEAAKQDSAVQSPGEETVSPPKTQEEGLLTEPPVEVSNESLQIEEPNTYPPSAESPKQAATEEDTSRIQSPGKEIISPPLSDTRDTMAESHGEVSGDQLEVENKVEEVDKKPPMSSADDEHLSQSTTEWESLIQPANAKEEKDAQTPSAVDALHIPSPTLVTKSDDEVKSSDGDTHVSSPTNQESVQSLVQEESAALSTVAEEAPVIESPGPNDEYRTQSPCDDEAETPASGIQGKHTEHTTEETEHQLQLTAEDSHIPALGSSQPDATVKRSDVDSVSQLGQSERDGESESSDAVSLTDPVVKREQELPTEGHIHEEVDTPKIIPLTRLNQQPTPEYEKFMSILVSQKGGKQENIKQANDDNSSKKSEGKEQDQDSSEVDNDAEPEDPRDTLNKEKDEAESRAESSAEAVFGSTTNLQEKIDSIQSPVPSVKEELIVKVDRFSFGSDPEDSRKPSSPDNVTDDVIASPITAQEDEGGVESARSDFIYPSPGMASSNDVDQKVPQSDPATAQADDSGGSMSEVKSLENPSEQQASPDVSPDNSKSTQGLESSLGIDKEAGLKDQLVSAEPTEDMDVAQDISEQTEDYEFDPLARTQSFIFPDDLAGRSSQLSEKPSSPFPDLDESDIRDASATPSSSEVKHVVEETDKAATEAGMQKSDEAMRESDANATALEVEKATPHSDLVKPEHPSTTTASDMTPVADKEDKSPSPEKVQPVAEIIPSEAEKGIDEAESESKMAETELATQPATLVTTEETAPATPEIPQSAVKEETDDPHKSPYETEQPSPDVEQAATKIQAGVRGWQARRKISRQQEAATQIQAGFRGWRVRHGGRTRRSSSLPDLSNAVPAVPDEQYMDVDTMKDRAAAKIQAGFRGWRARQEMKSLVAASPLEEAPRVSPAISMTEVSVEEQAATRIQAGYRGWKTRRTLKRSLSDPNSEALVLAESQQQKRVAETGAAASGPQPAAVDDRLTSSAEAVTPREEDDTAHSIQSIQSEVVSSTGTPRQEDNTLTTTPPPTDSIADAQSVGGASKASPVAAGLTVKPSDDVPSVGASHHGNEASTITPPVTDLTLAAQSIEEASKASPSRTESTMEPTGDLPPASGPCQANLHTADSSTASLASPDESQQAEAATKIQAGFRGWKTRQQMRTDPSDADAETPAVRPTVSAKSVTDSGALPIDFAIVHRPEDDWLTEDLMKIEAEKRAASGETAPEPKTDEKLVAASSDEPDGKEGKDARPDSASTTGSSSSWLTHAQTEIRASFQGLRDNVSDALKTVEDTARLVREKGAVAGAEGGAEAAVVTITEGAQKVGDSGAGASQPIPVDPQGSSNQAKEALAPEKACGQIGSDVGAVERSGRSPSEQEEEEIWEEIQRSMRHED